MLYISLYFFMDFKLPDDGFLLNSKHVASKKQLIYIQLCLTVCTFSSVRFWRLHEGRRGEEGEVGWKAGDCKLLLLLLS